MRILMLTQFYAPVVGGQERAVENLSRALVHRGHHVAVATLAQRGEPVHEIRDGVHVHRLPGTFQRFASAFADQGRRHVPPAPDPEAAIALRRLIEREQPDVIHAHDWFVHSLIAGPARSPVPVFLSVHDHSLVCANKRLMRGQERCSGPALGKCVRCAAQQYGALKGVPTAVSLRLRRRSVRSRVDQFLPVSEAVATVSHDAMNAAHVDVLPNFMPACRDAVADDDDVPRRFPSGPFLLFVGDATHDKGIDVLLAAHRMLGDDRPPLVIVGRPLADALAEPPSDVVVLGPLPHDEVLAASRASAIVVVPSLVAEAFGLVALEAMAMGRPVVAARSGGLGEVVVDGCTGLLTPPGDAAGLADALRRLLGDPELARRMGAAGRQRAEEFAEDAIVSRLERLYGVAGRGAQ